MSAVNRHIYREIPIAPLVVFRALFGLIMFISIVRFAVNGWIQQLYIDPTYFFTYPGFDWIKPLAPSGMYALFVVMGLAAMGIAVGFKYRLATILFFVSFTYVELIDKTNYLNHYYFVSIIAFLLLLAPANRAFSIDAWLNPRIRRTTVPAWTINMFKLQLGLVYFYAGLAKINTDWLLHAMPLKIWLAGKSDTPIIGNLFNYKWTAVLFSWFGMLYDLSVPFLLVLKRTRLLAYGMVIAFHLMTAALFKIGMFPYIMILSTLIFFPASFHQRVIESFYTLINYKPLKKLRSIGITTGQMKYSRFAVGLLAVHFAVQIALPLRSHLYDGNLYWNEQGYRFSWRVMLMEKAGYAQFKMKDADGKVSLVDNSKFLTPYQEKMMSTQPDMILQFSQHLAEVSKDGSGLRPTITVDTRVTLNGRRSMAIIDPNIDLPAQSYTPGQNNWITKYPYK